MKTNSKRGAIGRAISVIATLSMALTLVGGGNRL